MNNSSNCMFTGIAGCSREHLNFTRIVCSKHARDIFNISTRKRVLYCYEQEHQTITALAQDETSKNSTIIAPFPFTFESGTNANTDFTYISRSICLNVPKMLSSISAFVNSKQLHKKGYSPAQVQEIAQMLASYIQNQPITSISSQNPGLLINFQNFKAYQELPLKSYWGTGTESPLVNIALEDSSVINWPVAKLPLFYQALFVHFEFAEHVTQNGPSLHLIPNVRINESEAAICTFNQSPYFKIYRDPSVHADYISPLILTGTVDHKTRIPYEVFNRPGLSLVGTIDPSLLSSNIPKCT
nr:31K protein [Menippe mercenaria nudivirus]